MQSFSSNNANCLRSTAKDEEPSKKSHNFPKTNQTPKTCRPKQDLNKSSYSNGSNVPPKNFGNVCKEQTLQAEANPESKDILNTSRNSWSSDSCSSSSSSSTSSGSSSSSSSNSSCDSDSNSENDSDSSDSSSSDSKPNSDASVSNSKVNKTISSNEISNTYTKEERKRELYLPSAAYKSLSSSSQIIEKRKDCYSLNNISPCKSRNSFHTKWNEIKQGSNATETRTQHRFSAPGHTQFEVNQAKRNTSASDLIGYRCTDSQSCPTNQESRNGQSAGSETFQLKMKLIRINQKEWRVSKDSQVINERNRSLPGASNRVISGLKHSLCSLDDSEHIYKKRKI